MKRILMILTSHDRMPNGEPTGVWLEEFAVPYLQFSDAGHEIEVVSVTGGDVPIDPRSTTGEAQMSEWQTAVAALKATAPMSNAKADDFDAVYVPGGHGTAFDMPENKDLHQLLLVFWDQGKVVSAVCHAPALFGGMQTADGSYFIDGRKVTGFSDAEELAVGLEKEVPFLLESRLRELGADYTAADSWQPYVVQDGQLITGQNPASSKGAAEAVLAAL